MQTAILHLSDLDFNVRTWRRELKFHYNEMEQFEEKLAEISGRDNSKNDALLEQFQNRITIEKEAINKLLDRTKFKLMELERANNNKEEPFVLRNDATLQEDMKTYIKIHYDLKEEMMDYLLRLY
ncbi:MAG: hypothetical protein CSA39_04130 [Flavobacteriales bacterium]|nr:MAG: hypothetical protein CR985_02005 [Flavobacteriales bacterium]PIE49151.1 MAG: hypothetical protein CSA39_04130 [Flavobacteriales bacterium]